ncbi:MAG: GntR family transcriptional regulator [Microbacterium sp.]|uniref:GntR family transcriptional regulator n=1 Tax=Microbacterium sp. TaxID=51671 RepID=UPI003A86AF3F
MTANDSAPRPVSHDTSALESIAERHRPGYRSVGTMAYDIIREAILEGALAPGQKLRQELLAESIGISRVPVRSALIQLEADGLVEFHARRGAVVKTLSPETAREVYAIRTLLELEALRLSMADLSAERLERIARLAAAADDQMEGTDFIEVRTRFYAELYGAESRPMMWEMIAQLRLKLGRYVLGWRVVGGEHRHSHAELVAAVASQDVDAAQAVLRTHLESVRDAVLAMLDTDSGDDVGVA